MTPLTNDEAGLIIHIERWGSDGYPISRLGRKWQIGSFRSWKGFPILFKTKTAAVKQFEAWHDLALERWRAMKLANPNLIITQYEIKELS
jgi:hypothetical protein